MQQFFNTEFVEDEVVVTQSFSSAGQIISTQVRLYRLLCYQRTTRREVWFVSLTYVSKWLIPLERSVLWRQDSEDTATKEVTHLCLISVVSHLLELVETVEERGRGGGMFGTRSSLDMAQSDELFFVERLWYSGNVRVEEMRWGYKMYGFLWEIMERMGGVEITRIHTLYRLGGAYRRSGSEMGCMQASHKYESCDGIEEYYSSFIMDVHEGDLLCFCTSVYIDGLAVIGRTPVKWCRERDGISKGDVAHQDWRSPQSSGDGHIDTDMGERFGRCESWCGDIYAGLNIGTGYDTTDVISAQGHAEVSIKFVIRLSAFGSTRSGGRIFSREGGSQTTTVFRVRGGLSETTGVRYHLEGRADSLDTGVCVGIEYSEGMKKARCGCHVKLEHRAGVREGIVYTHSTQHSEIKHMGEFF
ncbi:hypothetical protein Tco_0748645 [Tanacetum coccineum]|uniref:Uncharacterized protein n=1 Tax=Tanacetum coccineum TaxID=301880 RepID=A0ABQ4YW71_9ASTR